MFRGPSRRYDVPASRFDRVMDTEGRVGGSRAAMRGVGGSARILPEDDSMYQRSLAPSPPDPIEGARMVGRAKAAAEGAASQQRFNDILNTGLVNQRQATRLVYGEGDILDVDPLEVRTAQSRFIRDPNREMAARAVSVGADPRGFPDRFQDVRRGPSGRGEMSLPLQNRYDALPILREERDIYSDNALDKVRLQSELRPGPRARLQRFVDKDRKIKIIDIDNPDRIYDTGEQAAGGEDDYLIRGGLDGDGDAASGVPAGGASRPRQYGSGMADIRTEAEAMLQKNGITEPTPEQVQDAMSYVSVQRNKRRNARGR